MSRLISQKTQGIFLLIAGLFLLINIPFIDEKIISIIIVIALGIYNLLK